MSLTKVSYSMINGSPANVLDYGAVGDGIADDTVALQTAFALQGKTVFLPAGTYLVSQTLMPRCAAIIGDGEGSVIIKFTAAVTTGMALNSTGGPYPRLLENFQLLGTLTNNCTGLWVGNTVNQVAITAINIRTKGFGGGSGIGRRISQCLKSVFINCTSEQNGENTLIEGVTGEFPTLIHFNSCVDTDSTVGVGVRVRTGYGITFTNHDFESSQTEGLFVSSDGSTSCDGIIVGDGCWFEDNQRALGATRNTGYHAVFGTNAGVGTIRGVVRSAYFDTNNTTGTALAVKFVGPENAGFVIDSPRFGADTPNSILVTNDAYGAITGWCGAFSLTGSVSDAGNRASWVQGGSRSYTPTYASSVGNAATTFSGAVTTTLAQYKLTGASVTIQLTFGATLNAVTPAYISVSLPTNITSSTNNAYSPALVTNGTQGVGSVRLDGGNTLYFYPAGGGNFTSGATVGASVMLQFLAN